MQKVLYLLLAWACSNYACAQFAETEYNAGDSNKVSYLDEVVVAANRIPETRRTVAQQVKIISPFVIRNFNAQTAADLLQNTGVVAMQKSQQGGGSPILRGFEASRVLLIVDGVRMNNLIYRSGHLQNVITVDNNAMQRVEVLFGPASTLYGSDALGGAVHFFTRDPELASTDKLNVFGNTMLRYGSANNEKAGNINFNVGGRKWALFTSFTYSDFDDLRMGERNNPAIDEPFGVRNQYAVRAADNQSDVLVQKDDPFVQKFSGYNQYDILQKVLYKPNERSSHLLNFQYSTSSDIPRYDRLTDPQGAGLRFAEWYYGPQERLMLAYQYKLNSLGAFADGMVATLSYQQVEESRYDRRFGNNNRNERIEDVDVWGLTVDFNKVKDRHKLRYGIDGQFSTVNSTARRYNVATGEVSPQSTRYPDGDNNMNTLSLFGTHTWEINNEWAINDGVRFGGSWLRATFRDQTFFPFPFDEINQNNVVASGNLGVIYTPSSWKISLMASTGYRVPNIDDLAKVFESVAGTNSMVGTLVVPNPDIKPEKTLNGDFSVTKFFGEDVRVEGTLFATEFFDAIVVQPGTFNGQSAINFDGFPANVVTSQNAARAYILGYSITGRAQLGNNFSLSAAYNYTRGRVKNEVGPETPLDHIPPAFGRVALGFNTTRFNSELFVNFNGWKRLRNYSTSGEDNLQYAIAGRGMPSWWTLNLRTSYDINAVFTVQAGVDNLLDIQYRLFASGINAAGRNIFGTLRIKF